MEKKKLIATCVIAALGGSWLIWMLATVNAGRATKPSPFLPVSSASTAALTVQVAGRVVHPGVYQLPANSRVQDALQKAGGLAPGADASALNLAAWLQDGAKIEVPARQDGVSPFPTTSTAPIATGASSSAPFPVITLAPPPLPISSVAPSASVPMNATPGAPLAQTNPQDPDKAIRLDALRRNPVNINVATLEQLDLLPEIGPKTAQLILSDRTLNGPFRTVDDLGRIKGIKIKTIDAMRPYVTVQ